MDFAIVVLRLVVGLLFVGHGTQKLLGWFGGPGLDGTEGMMHSLGYRPARAHAVLAGATEALGGLLLVLGFLTPLAAAAVIGVMLNAIGTVHGTKGLWVQNGGYEYNLVLITAAFAVATSAAGVGGGLLALVLGAVAAGIALRLRRPEEATAGAEVDLQAEDAQDDAREHRRAA
jgi:putative oxidoreductase